MTHIAKILAGLTERPVSFEARNHIYFGCIDIAHALGGLEDGHSLLLRVKYADQRMFIQDLERKFWLSVVDLWMAKKWPYPKDKLGKEFRRDMARLALVESIWPNICTYCGGWGEDPIVRLEEGKIVDCKKCHGSGKKFVSDEDRSMLMQVNEELWRRHYREKFGKIQSLLASWEDIGVGRMVRRLMGTMPENIETSQDKSMA